MTTLTGDTVQLLFEDTNRAIDLAYDADFVDLLKQIIPHWPFQILQGQDQFVNPFASIEKTRSGQIVSSAYSEKRKLLRNPVDTACELVALLAWATIEANPGWLCIHCAACEIDGGLVLFPAVRKSGKSTITAVLGTQEVPIFTDDFLGIEIDNDGNLFGISSGVATRMRFPWPENLSLEMKSKLQNCAVASNETYSYHRTAGVMPVARGKRSPIRAIIILDREDGTKTANLRPLSLDDVLTTIVEQNFARVEFAQHILTVLHFLAAHVPKYRLEYTKVEDGAKVIKDHFQSAECILAPPLPDQLIKTTGEGRDQTATRGAAIKPTQPLWRSEAVKCIEVEGQIYLAEVNGYGVHKLDQIGGAVWRLLSEPISQWEIASLLSQAFPEVPEQQVRLDIETLIDGFNHAGLITTDNA